MEISTISQNVHRFLHNNAKSQDKIELLLTTDIHYDSVNCNRELLTKHFDQAKERGAYICCFGDFFDLMQGKYDPRRKPKQALREEYTTIMREEKREYIDVVVSDAVQFLHPYKDCFKFISYGNHETTIKKNLETDPVERLVTLLNHQGHSVYRGLYEGYISFCFARRKAKIDLSLLLKYHHGYGGNAMRSKGILANQIEAYKWPDAVLVVTGHTHQKLYDFNVRERIGRYGKIETDTQYNLKCGSYKRKDTGMGWEVEKGFPHTPQGGWWVTLTFLNSHDDLRCDIDIKEAK